MSLADWAKRQSGPSIKTALTKLWALPEVEHGVAPPFAVGNKGTYHHGHMGPDGKPRHLSEEIRSAPVIQITMAGLRTSTRGRSSKKRSPMAAVMIAQARPRRYRTFLFFIPRVIYRASGVVLKTRSYTSAVLRAVSVQVNIRARSKPFCRSDPRSSAS